MSDYPFHHDKPKVAPPGASEVAIQASCKLRVETQFDARFNAVANGTWTPSYSARAKAKREGVTKGFPDAVITGGKRNPGKVAFVEFKAMASLSKEQRAILTELHECGHDVGVFRSQDTLAAWLVERGWR